MLISVKSKRNVSIVQVLIFISGLSISGSSFAALDAYLTLVGEGQGVIMGDVTLPGREGSIGVIGYNHKNGEGDNWKDCKEGVPAHEPLVIIKELDKATPSVYSAYWSGESFSTFALRFWRPNLAGEEEHYFTIELVNARIMGVEQQMLNNRIPENVNFKVMERVSFIYDEIHRTYEDGGFSAGGEWKTGCGK